MKLDVPRSANVDTWDDQLLVSPRDAWTIGATTWPRVLAVNLTGFLKGERGFTSLFTPTPNSALSDYTSLKTALVTNALVDVHNVLTTWARQGGRWVSRPFEVVSGLAAVSVLPVDSDETPPIRVTAT